MSGVTVRFIGSGPYCYANSLAMMLGSVAPEPAVIEVLTGSPFGAGLLGGVTAFFNPLGWDPGVGLDTAIGLLGWTCRPSAGGPGTKAAARLGEASESRPLLAGPLEFGLLLHHPDSGTAIGSDHYVVVTGVWRTASCASTTPTVTRTRRCRRTISSPPGGPTRSATPPSRSPPGLAFSGSGTSTRPPLVETGLEPWQHDHLGYFAIRVGARRLSDASACLAFIGESKAASIAGEQARLVGAMQYPLVAGDRITLARLLRRLAPTYEQLRASLPGG
jgi:hypothetical protein